MSVAPFVVRFPTLDDSFACYFCRYALLEEDVLVKYSLTTRPMKHVPVFSHSLPVLRLRIGPFISLSPLLRRPQSL